MPTKAADLITIDEVRKLLRDSFKLKKISRPTIYNWMKTRQMPQPIGYGIPRTWRLKEIETWIEQQIKGK